MSSMEILIDIIENAKRYVKGELELDLIDGVWVAMDYREELGGAFPIEIKGFNNRIITEHEANKYKLDVRACCDVFGIAYVG